MSFICDVSRWHLGIAWQHAGLRSALSEETRISSFMAVMYSLALFVLYLSLVTPSIAQHKKKVLVLGGDGMLGSETVARLKLRGHQITILHRGTWYWDSSLRIKPWVNFVQCDRDRFKECADKLGDITREKGMFDAVIDFSGYKPSHIKVNSRPLLHFQLNNFTLFWLNLVHDRT